MSELPYNAYGQQLVFDGYGANGKLCGDVKNLYKFLMDFPASIGMTRIGFPHIIHIEEDGIKGLSGFVFIMESHICVHTYEERGFVTADVYSCKTFDEHAAAKALKETFGVSEHEQSVLIRGRRFNAAPTDLLDEELVGTPT